MEPRSSRSRPPLTVSSPPELSPEDELRESLGRAIGFTVAAFVLLVGGGILVIVVAGIFFGFLYGS